MAAAATRQNGKQAPYKLDALTREIPIEFELRGLEWSVSADPDVEVIATMMRLEEKLLDVDDLGDLSDDDSKTLADYVIEAKELVLDLIADWPTQKQPLDRVAFRITVTEVLTLFGLITGSPRVADAVAQAITAGASSSRNLDDLTDEERELLSSAGGEDGSPLRSRSRSSRRSSRSAGSTSGRRPTGGD